MAVAISLTANPAGAGSGTTITYSGQSIGTADVNRIVVVCVGAELSSGSPSSATIDYGSGAVSMSAGTLGSIGAVFSRIFYAYAPTGTTADIAITFGASQGSTTHAIAVYRVTGAKFSAENAVGDTDADPISSGAITIPTGGGCIGICAMAADTTARTWTGITEDPSVDADAGTFRFTTGTSTTAGTPTITVSGANNEDGALSWIIFAPGYQLGIDAGSYAVTGQAVSVEHRWSVSSDAGSYAVSGQAVDLSRGSVLGIDAGSYAVTGQDVSLDYAAAQNRAIVSFAEISFAVGSAVKQVIVNAGSYSIAGQDVSLQHAWIVPVDAGSYAVTGQDVALSRGLAVAVDAGAYAVTGQDIALTGARLLGVDAGSYSVAGQDVTLTHAYAVSVGAGSYTVSGQDVALAHTWALPIEAGSYAVTGQDVALTKTGAYDILVEAGSYTVNGQDVSLQHGWVVPVDAGSYAVTGQGVSLELDRAVTVDAGSYAVTGQDIALAHQWAMDAGSGSYLVSGQDVALTRLGALLIDADAGSYAIGGQDVDLELDAGDEPVTTPEVWWPVIRRGERETPEQRRARLLDAMLKELGETPDDKAVKKAVKTVRKLGKADPDYSEEYKQFAAALQRSREAEAEARAVELRRALQIAYAIQLSMLAAWRNEQAMIALMLAD